MSKTFDFLKLSSLGISIVDFELLFLFIAYTLKLFSTAEQPEKSSHYSYFIQCLLVCTRKIKHLSVASVLHEIRQHKYHRCAPGKHLNMESSLASSVCLRGGEGGLRR